MYNLPCSQILLMDMMYCVSCDLIDMFQHDCATSSFAKPFFLLPLTTQTNMIEKYREIATGTDVYMHHINILCVTSMCNQFERIPSFF
jgi:hypothetical protein